MVELINHFRHIASELEAGLARKPEIEEIAKEMKLPIKKAKAVQRIVKEKMLQHIAKEFGGRSSKF